ncbi:hypothetical protein Tco_1120906, partial [Tanacetum coccineum]
MIAEEIKKLVERTANVGADEVDSSILTQNDPRTRFELKSNKESLEVEITAEVQPVNVNKEEEELVEDDYELKRKGKREEYTEKLQELTINDQPPSSSTPSSSSPKPNLSASQHILSLFKPKTRHFKCYKSFFDELQGRYRYLFEYLKTRFMQRKKFHELAQHLQEGLIMERQQSQADVAKMIADAIQQERENLCAKISSQINNAITNHIPSQVDSSVRNYISGYILHVHPTQTSPASAQEQQYQLYLTMKDNPQLQHDDLLIWLALKYKFERPHVSNTSCRPYVVRPRDQDNPHDDAHPERENSAKRHKTSEHGTYMFGES